MRKTTIWWTAAICMAACGKSGPREGSQVDGSTGATATNILTSGSADTTPAAAPDTTPAAAPDTTPAAAPDTTPAAAPDAEPAAAPDAEPAAAPDAEPAAAPDAEPAPALPTRPGRGIVPEDELNGLWEALAASPHAVDRNAQLNSARACVESPHDGCEQVPEGILAVMGQDVAVRIADDVGGCGDVTEAFGWIASADKPKPRERVKLFSGDVDDAAKLEAAVWRYVAGLVEKGFTPAKSLIVARLEAQSGIRAYVPLVYLAPPLAGYFARSEKNDKGGSTLSIVSPDNQSRIELGEIPVLKNKACKGEAREEQMCGDFGDTGFEDIALSSDGLTLFVLGSQSDGSHCGGSPTFFRAFPVPAGLVDKTRIDRPNP